MSKDENAIERRSKARRARIAGGVEDRRAQDIVSEIYRSLGDHAIDAIYRDRVLAQRTRRYEWPAPPSKSQVQIQHTLLGIELKIGRRRLMCPDLATARYISIFARLGCSAVAIPYDITQLSRLSDELESSWHRTNVLVDHLTAGRTSRLRARVRRCILERLREAVEKMGAGERFPRFNENTSQRRS